jgi:hypothetical protein
MRRLVAKTRGRNSGRPPDAPLMQPKLDSRPTPVSAGEATAEVWMLLSDRDGVRVRMGRKGLLGMEDARTAARGLVPAARGVFRCAVLERGCRDGRIRLGDVQRLPMVAD